MLTRNGRNFACDRCRIRSGEPLDCCAVLQRAKELAPPVALSAEQARSFVSLVLNPSVLPQPSSTLTCTACALPL